MFALLSAVFLLFGAFESVKPNDANLGCHQSSGNVTWKLIKQDTFESINSSAPEWKSILINYVCLPDTVFPARNCKIVKNKANDMHVDPRGFLILSPDFRKLDQFNSVALSRSDAPQEGRWEVRAAIPNGERLLFQAILYSYSKENGKNKIEKYSGLNFMQATNSSLLLHNEVFEDVRESFALLTPYRPVSDGFQVFGIEWNSHSVRNFLGDWYGEWTPLDISDIDGTLIYGLSILTDVHTSSGFTKSAENCPAVLVDYVRLYEPAEISSTRTGTCPDAATQNADAIRSDICAKLMDNIKGHNSKPNTVIINRQKIEL